MHLDLLAELEEDVAERLTAHLHRAETWMPHRYVPWSRGRDFSPGDADVDPTVLPSAVRDALVINLLTEDQLPSYHLEIATRFGRDGAWGQWVHQWTAEEARHATALRDYLVTTRAVDADALERARMHTMQIGYTAGDKSVAESLVYTAIQELATRVAHSSTGLAAAGLDPDLDTLLRRIARDENLHMVFYRGLCDTALLAAPSAMTIAICTEISGFEMPGASVAIPGFQRRSVAVARAGIYDLTSHLRDVLTPLIRHWRIFDRSGLDGRAEAARQHLAEHLAELEGAARRQRERVAELAERRKARR